MESIDNIPDDFENLERYAPNLYKIGKDTPFSVPPNYFESLPEIVNTVVKVGEISPLLKNNNIPEGYFDELPSFINAQTLLADIKKENPFVVPAGYFDCLPAQIQEVIQTQKQKISFFALFQKLFSPRLALVFSGLLVIITGIYFLQKPVESINNNLQLSDLTKKELSETTYDFDESYLMDELSEEDADIANENPDYIADYLIDNNVEVSTLLKEM